MFGGDYEKEIFRKVFDMDVNEVYMAVGCEECGNGYKGRIALHEVLLINQDIRDAIINNITSKLFEIFEQYKDCHSFKCETDSFKGWSHCLLFRC